MSNIIWQSFIHFFLQRIYFCYIEIINYRFFFEISLLLYLYLRHNLCQSTLALQQLFKWNVSKLTASELGRYCAKRSCVILTLITVHFLLSTFDPHLHKEKLYLCGEKVFFYEDDEYLVHNWPGQGDE